MLRFLRSMISCPHSRETWPLTRRARDGRLLRARPPYVACLHCGRERDYDWAGLGALPANQQTGKLASWREAED